MTRLESTKGTAFEGMQLAEVIEERDLHYLTVTVQVAGASVPCRFRVDGLTALELGQILAFKPFPERPGVTHTYWHEGCLIPPDGRDLKYRVKVCADDMSKSIYVPCSDKFLRHVRWIMAVGSAAELEDLRYPA